mmetsp:Transcript_47720/g.153572  ORF Transcript_47720/g.153572 Transcript_47720/m.153572 type:complete len:236 (-) Transcript_47720:1315-2022(-)
MHARTPSSPRRQRHRAHRPRGRAHRPRASRRTERATTGGRGRGARGGPGVAAAGAEAGADADAAGGLRPLQLRARFVLCGISTRGGLHELVPREIETLSRVRVPEEPVPHRRPQRWMGRPHASHAPELRHPVAWPTAVAQTALGLPRAHLPPGCCRVHSQDDTRRLLDASFKHGREAALAILAATGSLAGRRRARGLAANPGPGRGGCGAGPGLAGRAGPGSAGGPEQKGGGLVK